MDAMGGVYQGLGAKPHPETSPGKSKMTDGYAFDT